MKKDTKTTEKKWLVYYTVHAGFGKAHKNEIITGSKLTENLLENMKSAISDKYNCLTEDIVVHNVIKLDD